MSSVCTIPENSTRSDAKASEIIYQIYPATFCDSDHDGHGDLQGIIQKLDYVKFLGVDAIWLSPIYPSPEGPEGDGGYAVTNRRGIDPRFGTLDDFKMLLDESHKRGLRIYMDDVLPHTSHQHEWFLASSAKDENYKDFYIWHDGQMVDGERRPPNNWLSVFGGGAWEWHEERQQYYMHHFLKSQPALNLNNPKVQDAVLEDMKFWLDMGVDGFRFDSLSYANYDPQFRDNPWMHHHDRGWTDQYFAHSHCQPQTTELVARIRQLMDSYPQKKTTLGEVICGREGGRNPMPVAADYVDPRNGLDMCYTDAFRALNHQTGHQYLQNVIKSFFDYFPHGGHCNALSNHDSPRMASRGGHDIPEAYKGKALRQIMRLMTVLPGSLSIYQGEELGLGDARIPDDIPPAKLRDPIAQTKGLEHCRDGARTPMPWCSGKKNAGFSSSDNPYLPIPDDHYHRAVSKQAQNTDSMLHFVKSLVDWRKNQPVLKNGQGFVLPTMAPLIALLRKSEEQTILCLFNMSEQNMMFKPADLLDQQTLDTLGISKDEVVRLQPYDSDFRGGYILDQKPCPQAQQRLTL